MDIMTFPVVFLVGPTAIGKSRVAIPIAKALKTEILTSDSTQVYRGMDVGTDKPRLAERNGVPHRLIDLVAPDEPFNAGLYRRLALQEIARLHAEGRVPLVVEERACMSARWRTACGKARRPIGGYDGSCSRKRSLSA